MYVLYATGTFYLLHIETFVVYKLHLNVHLFKCELHMYTCKVFDASFTLNHSFDTVTICMTIR